MSRMPWATEAGAVTVSTVYRQSSALVNSAPWYYETLGFADEDGSVVWASAAPTEKEAHRQHDLAARYYRSRP